MEAMVLGWAEIVCKMTVVCGEAAGSRETDARFTGLAGWERGVQNE